MSSDFNPGDKSTKGSTIAAGSVDSTTHQFTGSIYITGTINCLIDSGSGGGAGSFVALDANNQFVLDEPAGGGGSTDAQEAPTLKYNIMMAEAAAFWRNIGLLRGTTQT